MRKFKISRVSGKSSKLLLASGPLVVLLACNAYDEALSDASESVAGSSGDGGMTAGGSTNPSGGSDGGKGTRAGSAGEPAGGKGGSAGERTSGSDAGGSADTSSGAANGGAGATAGSDAGGQSGSEATIVDDMEDTDAQISVAEGRNGYWYVGNDGSAGGTQAPTAAHFEMFELTSGEQQHSTYSAHMKVSGFTGWGSVIGFNLVEQQAVLKPYDASAFCGVEFWGKAAAATSLRVRLPDGDTHPAGMVCKEAGAANTLCHDHFSVAIALTTSWKSFSISFASLQQIGSGYHPADNEFRADQLYAMEWALPGAAGKAFEIWIDDVALVACQ